MAVILTLALVGCGDTQSQEDYYTQEEVDELIQNAINNDKNYTQEEVYDIINTLLIDMIDFKYDDMVDISYDEETKIFTITQYNQYNEVFSVDTYTIDEIMDELGYA